MGHVRESFDRARIDRLAGQSAMGHVLFKLPAKCRSANASLWRSLTSTARLPFAITGIYRSPGKKKKIRA